MKTTLGYQGLCKKKKKKKRNRLHHHVTTFPYIFFFTKTKKTNNPPVICFVSCRLTVDNLRRSDSKQLDGWDQAAPLEMCFLLWDRGYFAVGLEFCVVGSVGAEGGVFPPHFQVLAGSCQLLHSLLEEKNPRVCFERCCWRNNDVTCCKNGEERNKCHL